MGRADLYKEALHTANEVLALTKGLVLTGEEAVAATESKNFSRMVEKRGPLVEKIIQLRKQALNIEEADSAQSEAQWKAVRLVIEQIAAEDEKQKVMVEKVKSSIMAAIKDARESVKLNETYAIPAGNFNGGMLDIKN